MGVGSNPTSDNNFCRLHGLPLDTDIAQILGSTLAELINNLNDVVAEFTSLITCFTSLVFLVVRMAERSKAPDSRENLLCKAVAE